MTKSTLDDLRLAVAEADFICHLAGVNRPDDVGEFARVNTDLTKALCQVVQKSGCHVPIIFASSVHVGQDSPYGASKLAAEQVRMFRASRDTLVSERVGDRLARALCATYIGYLPLKDFACKVPKHIDPRGVFVKMLKTKDSGQLSFFTAHPGVTRGGLMTSPMLVMGK